MTNDIIRRFDAISQAVARIEQEATVIKQETSELADDITYQRFCGAINAVAAVGATITYKPLGKAIGLFSAHLSPLLARRMEEDHAAGRSLSCALVVNANKMSSAGFFQKARQLGYQFTDEAAFWVQQRDGAWREASA